MNTDSELICRCLAGEASTADWKSLDQRVAEDPGMAQLWCRESRLHADLDRLLQRRRPATRALHIGLLAGLGIAVAACIGAAFLLLAPDSPGRAGNQTADVDSAPPLRESLPAQQPGPDAPTPAPAPAPVENADAVPLLINSVQTGDRIVALRFSDGPHEKNTPRLLDILKAEGVTATFFCVGTNVERYPEIIRRMAAEGHEIGNHTWTHPACAKLTDEKLREEVRRAQEAIREITGKAPGVFKPPYGSITRPQAELLRKEFGLITTLWSLDPMDWKTKNAAKTEAAVIEGVRPGAFVLIHDIHSTSVDAVPGILRRLKSDGWKFMTVSAIMAHGKPVEAAKQVPAGQETLEHR